MPSNLVYYHLPEDDQFSLDFVNPDRELVDERLSQYGESTTTCVETYDLGEPFFAIYTRTDAADSVEDIRYGLDQMFAEMDETNRVIVREFLEMFEGVLEQKYDEEGVPLDAYKDTELERIPDALEHVDWAREISETGGLLLSNLILCHALPNANHRTSFVMLETYLNASYAPFNFPSLVTGGYDWQEWVDEYIVESKRLLTIRRNVSVFRYLQHFGCEIVRRKGGIDIRLSDYDLALSGNEALVEYASRHERLSVEFVEELLDQAGYSELLEERGPGKSRFARYLDVLD